MKHTLILTLLLILTSTACQHRTPITSVFAEAESLMYTHPDSALHLLEAIPNPEQLTGKAQADYALLLTQAKSRNRIYATSDSLIRIAVDYYKNSDEMGQKAKSLLYLADVMMDMERYADATLPLKQAEELMEHVSDRQIQTMIYSNLGYLNRKAGDYELALTYYKKALAINQTHQDTDRIVSNLINIIDLEVTNNAHIYIQQLQKAVVDASPSLQEKAFNNIGVYYKDRNLFKEAEHFFQKSILLAKKVPHHSFRNLADIYIAQEKYEQADSLYQIALQSPNWAIQARIYENLYKSKLDLGQIKEAIHYMNQYIHAVDSFYTNREASQIQEIQQKYDQEAILREKAEIENILYRILFIFLSILLIIAAITWYQKKKHREKLQELQIQIHKMTLSDKAGKDEISLLKEMLVQYQIIRQEYQETIELASKQNIDSLATYIRLLQAPESYNPQNDFNSLKHWLNLGSKNFTQSITQKHPQLTPVELTLCCLQRIGYTQKQMSIALRVKEDTIKRNIYRTCSRLSIKSDFTEFVNYITNL